MFWDKWIPEKYHYKQEVCAVEAVYSDIGLRYYYTHLKTKGAKLEVLSSGVCDEPKQLPNAIIKNKIPLVVIVNGKGVVLKKAEWSEAEEDAFDAARIIETQLPALQMNEFYIQLYRQAAGSGYIALCRKDLADALQAELTNLHPDLAAFYIGTPVITGLQTLWQNYNSLHTAIHTVELTNGKIDTITTTVSDAERPGFNVEDVRVAPEQLTGFAAGFAYLTRQHVAVNLNAAVEQVSIAHTERNKFRFLQIVAVAIALCLALTNVFFYSKYFNASNAIDSELNVYQGKNDEINRLLNDYQKKKDLIEHAGVLHKNAMSEYADRIASTLPDGVVLTDMQFNPPVQNDEDSLVSYLKNQITIKGNCNKSLTINEWENVLKMQSFIKDVSLEKFIYNSEGFIPNFELKVTTKE